PLVAIFRSGSSYTRYYYLTDGRGRLLAFTDDAGYSHTGDQVYWQTGGNQAGAIGNSNSYVNTRAESPQAPRQSFYRNRYYDQQTGRFTEEDPIGVAGGLNLYQYAGNNPASFTDPFGLCSKADRGERRIRIGRCCQRGRGERRCSSLGGSRLTSHHRKPRGRKCYR